MAKTQFYDVACTNKLCDYTGQVNLLSSGKTVCPKCGFKTLADVDSLTVPTVEFVYLPIKEKHDWVCISPGQFASLYECSKCEATYTIVHDDFLSYLPNFGCKGKPV